ncbi:alpha/beta-hydrolase [Schizopora paradoxa]|uniref:Alpha/beta-hydrolase n=1 Tax=Schizopora paradoxa TaxID=27342 RepID=A0A0H2RB83_9AGAM|nr:alpha/beta-hydrolase [Schizopora paradoxa]
MSGFLSLRREPFKSLYLLFCKFDILLRKPWWVIRNLLPSWRPRRSWPMSWCLQINEIRYYEAVSKAIGTNDNHPTAKELRLGPGVLGLYVDGVPQLVHDKLQFWARTAGVEPTRIPGYWMHQPGEPIVMGSKPAPGEKVVLYFHGGGYVIHSAHPDSPTSYIARSVVQHCAAAGANIRRIFNLEYRLSSHDPYPRENPFPAALLDALAGYAYLINDVGFLSSDIVIAGDSAGGNLALALTRYLLEMQAHDEIPAEQKLKPPFAMILLSPWADVSNSYCAYPRSSVFTNARSDFLIVPSKLHDGTYKVDYELRAYSGVHGIAFAETNEYVSPGSAAFKDEDISFRGFPPTYITSGSGEILLDQIRALVRRMQRDVGGNLIYYEADDAIHDFIGFPWQEPQRTTTLKNIGKWMSELLSKSP